MAAYQGRADSSHKVGLAGVVPIVYIAAAAAEHAVRANRTGDRLTCAVDVVDFGEGNDRTQQRFAGYAGPIRTFAADEFALDHRNPQAAGPGAIGGILSDRSGVQHHNVIGPF